MENNETEGKDTRNVLRLKKQNKEIKERVIRDIRALPKSKKKIITHQWRLLMLLVPIILNAKAMVIK